jgi:nitroreductase
MDTLEAINNRRSVRKYLDKPVEFEKITTILDAARHAPSAGNLQDRTFIVVTEKTLIKQIASYAVEQYWIETAPLAIVACSLPDKHEKYYGLRGKRLYNMQDCAAAIENILLAATDLGLSTCWVGAFEEEKIRTMFAIPANVRPQAIITVGYADEAPQDRPLVPIENMVFFNRFGMKVEKLHIVLRDYAVEWQRQSESAKRFTKSKFKRILENIKTLPERMREYRKRKKLERMQKENKKQ